MVVLDGGICSPKGFYAAGDHIGIKKKKKDLSLIYSEVPAKAAAVFTTNKVKAAPVLWNQKIIQSGHDVRAIVINSGVANSCTGWQGTVNNRSMAEKTAECLGIDSSEVLVASTGVIGVQLPMEIIKTGISCISGKLGNSKAHAMASVEGIMTTDTFPKTVAVSLKIGGREAVIAGMAKGSGMIHPNMATMLSFITTDINISANLLNKAMKEVTEDTYNMISVDGDTSTNDMAIALANGMAGNEQIIEENADYSAFKEAFGYVNESLAKLIVKDGEGASKFLEIRTERARTKEDARKIIRTVITSNLVKTAFFGEDANWGRVIAAMGRSGAEFDADKVTISFNSRRGSITLMDSGNAVLFDERLAASILSERDITVLIDLDDGIYGAAGWGCDLTYEYVKINGAYRT